MLSMQMLRVIVLLSLLLNACIIHGFLLVDSRKLLLSQLLRMVREGISNKDHYRSNGSTSTLSKIIETILNSYISLIQTSDNQFGFKSDSSTD